MATTREREANRWSVNRASSYDHVRQVHRHSNDDLTSPEPIKNTQKPGTRSSGIIATKKPGFFRGFFVSRS